MRSQSLHKNGSLAGAVFRGPLVSIVINNYNYGRYLAQAIRSAVAQTYAHCEVIVIDDGSTDDSLAVAAAFVDSIRVVAKANGGQASAFNRGFAEARGEWILFLDADDELYPEAIERAVPLMQPGVCKIHFPLQVRHVSKGRDEIGGLLPDSPLSEGDVVPLISSQGVYTWPPTSGNVFAAGCLGKILPMPEDEFRICADLYLCLKIAPLGEMRAANEPLGIYRIHGANNHTRFSLEPKSLRQRALAYGLHQRLVDEVGGAGAGEHTWSIREAFEGALLARRFGGGDPLPGVPDLPSLRLRRQARLAREKLSAYHRFMEWATWLILLYGCKPRVAWWLGLRERKARRATVAVHARSNIASD